MFDMIIITKQKTSFRGKEVTYRIGDADASAMIRSSFHSVNLVVRSLLSIGF